MSAVTDVVVTLRRPVPSTGSQVTQATERLARRAFQYRDDVNRRVLRGQVPLVVRWHQCTGDHADPTMTRTIGLGRTSEIEPLADHLRRHHRLVILGPSEAGKTTLAYLLADRLLQTHQDHPADPVPVIVPATSWRPGENVRNWLERYIGEQNPDLRNTDHYGSDVIRCLLAERRVLPVIDGLDELNTGPRELILKQLGTLFSYDDPLTVTCRSTEYHEAVEATGKILPAAAVIELQPVSTKDAISFLEHAAAGPRSAKWRPVLQAIRRAPDGPLAAALSSALMVTLARDTYDARDTTPAELTRYTERPEIERHLLGALIPARFSQTPAGESGIKITRREAQHASRWLAALATHMGTVTKSHDLEWSRLCYAVPAFRTPLRRAALGGAVAWIVAGILFGISRGLAFGAAEGVMDALAQGFDSALIVSSAYLLAPSYPADAAMPTALRRLREHIRTPVRIAIATPAAYAMESGLRGAIEHGAQAGLEACAGNWAIAAVIVWLAARAHLFHLAEEPVYFNLHVPGRGASLARYLAIGLVWGTLLGVPLGYAVDLLSTELAREHPYWGLGAAAGATLGAAFALVSWGRTPSLATQPTSPQSTLRADRNLTLLLAMPLLVVIPLFYGIGFASIPHNGFHDFARFTLYGLGIGITIWLIIALSHAWPQYLITIAWLATRGKLPWRLATFLEKACDLGILRQVGAVYQFRHNRLLEYLTQDGGANRVPAAARDRSVEVRTNAT